MTRQELENMQCVHKEIQFAEYLRNETGCGMMLATDCIRKLVDAIKIHPKHRKTDVGYRLKMECEEFSLRELQNYLLKNY